MIPGSAAPILLPVVAGGGLTIGQSYEGGYYAGTVTYNTFDYVGNLRDDDTWLLGSSTPTYHLIMAPKSLGESSITLQFKTSITADSQTATWDGYYNTYSVFGSSSVHPAAEYCRNLTIAGYSDWYLPAVYEQGHAFKNLQNLSDWQSGGSEEYEFSGATHYDQGNYWSSTSRSSSTADGYMTSYIPNGGTVLGFTKTDYSWVRAIRRVAV